MKSKSLEQWREYFESGNCSIYQIIFNAIRVAALDDPQEFKLRRKRIAERLYSCQFTGSCCCVDQTEQDVHSTITQVFQECKKACARKGAKVHDSTVIAGGKATDQANNELENNVEVERENIRCVLQIKDELENKELTDTEIYESLTKLQLMVRSVGVMEYVWESNLLRVAYMARTAAYKSIRLQALHRGIGIIFIVIVDYPL
ncbi:probable mediator of RNA polymerase II transcription subunit 26a [Prosopis cineraria]|uniref:probable mediator of RNA polymerase II transcription subunit 26a n=1 Tax=Prosopis cineraria TaxID=364024 RepID=UPI00240F463A|nr:probable mediator of RNA polymerase II transcription subunit 26a [Prosopis cineraria]